MRDAATENREVTWEVPGIPAYGTVTAPADRVVRPTFVFAAERPDRQRLVLASPVRTNDSARMLAEALAGHGFRTLGQDKLASGPHVRENLPRLLASSARRVTLAED